MAILTVRKPDQVPAPDKATKAVQEQRRIYESFIKDIGSDVGELELSEGETPRKVKVALTRAATRQGATIQTWDANGKIYFSKIIRRGRPRKAK